MSNKDTKPNIKRIAADTIGTFPGWVISSAIAVTACITVIPSAMEGDALLPDQIGSAVEESITAQHQTRFAELQEMKSQINLLGAETAFTGGSAKLTELKTAFGKQAVAAYMDLYLAGASNDGAALSEENFDNLRNTFAEKIANPAELGFQENISAAMLDETLAKTDLGVKNSADRFETVKRINGELATALEEQEKQHDISYTVAGVAGFASVMLLLLLSAGTDKWKYSPRRVPRRQPKKTGPYGGH